MKGYYVEKLKSKVKWFNQTKAMGLFLMMEEMICLYTLVKFKVKDLKH